VYPVQDPAEGCPAAIDPENSTPLDVHHPLRVHQKLPTACRIGETPAD